MYSKYLKSFILAADLSSFNKAAAKLGVSPTAIMRQMDVLEKNTGIKLLKRTNHGVWLTKAGEYFYNESKSIMSQCENIIQKAKTIQSEEDQDQAKERDEKA